MAGSLVVPSSKNPSDLDRASSKSGMCDEWSIWSRAEVTFQTPKISHPQNKSLRYDSRITIVFQNLSKRGKNESSDSFVCL